MMITSERVGDSVVVTVEEGTQEITLILPLDAATRLGTTLLMQTSLLDSEVTVPAEWAEADS